jgi:hypothetical protein
MSTTVKRPEMPHPEGTEKARTVITAFIRRFPVPTFYTLVFAISWEQFSSSLVPMDCSARAQRCRSPAAPHCSPARPSQASC